MYLYLPAQYFSGIPSMSSKISRISLWPQLISLRGTLKWIFGIIPSRIPLKNMIWVDPTPPLWNRDPIYLHPRCTNTAPQMQDLINYLEWGSVYILYPVNIFWLAGADILVLPLSTHNVVAQGTNSTQELTSISQPQHRHRHHLIFQYKASQKKCASLTSAPNHLVRWPKVVSYKKVVETRLRHFRCNRIS